MIVIATNKIATILSIRDNLSGGLIKVSKNVKDMDKKTKRATLQVQRFANKSIKNFERIGDKSVKMVAGISGIVGALALKTGLTEAMDLEGFRTQLETATKSSKKAGEIMAWSTRLANKTPFETGSVVEMSSKFESMGLSAKKWGGITADMAGATNKDIIQATEAIIDAQNGEMERMKEFGIKKQDIADKAAKMFKGKQIINNKGQIVDQEKFNEAMMELTNDKFKGGAEKQANTFRGMWSTVTGITKSAMARIVGIQEDGTLKQGSLFDTLKSKIQSVSDKLVEWQENGTIDELSANFTEKFNSIYDSVKQLMDFMVNNKTAIEGFAIAFGSLYAAVKVMKALEIAMWAFQIATVATSETLMLTPIGWITLAIAGLVAIGIALYKNWDKICDKAAKLWDWLKKIKGVGGIFKFIEKYEKKEGGINSKAEDSAGDGGGGGKKLKKYALGGIASEASIFGETGEPEMAIPLNNSQRSKDLLEQTNNLIGGNSLSSAVVNVIFKGDVYGHEDFEEKVCGVVVDAINQNKPNLV